MHLNNNNLHSQQGGCMQIFLTQIHGTIPVLNDGETCLCGGGFDREGVCPNLHQRDVKFYIYDPTQSGQGEPSTRSTTRKLIRVVCVQVGGSKCSVCGSDFPDGDDVCSGGEHHQIDDVYDRYIYI